MDLDNIVGGSRVKWERDGDELDDLGGTDESPQESFFQKVIKYCKILVPHVGLNILLLSYIAFGALVFIFLEADDELRQRQQKLKQILNVYQLIMEESVAICRSGDWAQVSPSQGVNGSVVGLSD